MGKEKPKHRARNVKTSKTSTRDGGEKREEHNNLFIQVKGLIQTRTSVLFLMAIALCIAIIFNAPLPMKYLSSFTAPSQGNDYSQNEKEGYPEKLYHEAESQYEALKQFKTDRQFSLRPQKITVGRREVTFRELQHNKRESNARIFVADDFLSPEECNGLSAVHSRHVTELKKIPPLMCFDGMETLQKNLEEVGLGQEIQKFKFIPETLCLNETASRFLETKFVWSYSTAFYPGESKFSHILEDRLEEATHLTKLHGGKFQITSYPQNIGYKNHTDCTVGAGLRDRFATVLVYLQDVREGGETVFPLLGVKVKPKQGRLLVWNNMSPDGRCDETSLHNAAKVIKGHKFILQRWYYYENFFSLGKRPPEPLLPKRKPRQPRVSCDQYEYGSCRWYDEWGYDHILEYNQMRNQLP